MPNDTDKHRELLSALRAAQASGNANVDEAVVRAFEHVFEHLERLNSHVSAGGPEGEGRPLEAGESPTLR
ncbi:MAG: hypothetical protein K2Y56_15945 [Methylobacterium sp.]|uniref:hypothetical protein n=1 Tax=Methylobacterium sp. TaxID=409 RepID=UPI0025CECCE2|nr:hypothetical protein [Methylobacterium sp.]MBX9933007.1 hypothetical protein [Methylobacterium sp.]